MRPTVQSVCARTGGVADPGHVVGPSNKTPASLDASTLLKWLRVILPTVKTAALIRH